MKTLSIILSLLTASLAEATTLMIELVETESVVIQSDNGPDIAVFDIEIDIHAVDGDVFIPPANILGEYINIYHNYEPGSWRLEDVHFEFSVSTAEIGGNGFTEITNGNIASFTGTILIQPDIPGGYEGNWWHVPYYTQNDTGELDFAGAVGMNCYSNGRCRGFSADSVYLQGIPEPEVSILSLTGFVTLAFRRRR